MAARRAVRSIAGSSLSSLWAAYILVFGKSDVNVLGDSKMLRYRIVASLKPSHVVRLAMSRQANRRRIIESPNLSRSPFRSWSHLSQVPAARDRAPFVSFNLCHWMELGDDWKDWVRTIEGSWMARLIKSPMMASKRWAVELEKTNKRAATFCPPDRKNCDLSSSVRCIKYRRNPWNPHCYEHAAN